MNLAECLCYATPIAAIGVIASILWLATEPKANYQLRYNAGQNLLISVALFAVGLVFSIGITVLNFIPFIGGVMAGFSGLIYWIILMGGMGLYGYLAYQAYHGNTIKLPYVCDIVDSAIK
jgi:uncharacterized membrane protein